MKKINCVLFSWPWNWKEKQGGGAILQGVGSILAAVAAIIALSHTGDILKKILEVQEQAKQITVGVEKLNESSNKLEAGIDELKEINKDLKKRILRLDTTHFVESSPPLRSNQAITISQARDAIKPLASSASGMSNVYLPIDKIDETAAQLAKETNPDVRINILQNKLVIRKQAVIENQPRRKTLDRE